MKTIGKRVKELRLEKNWSQSELARRTGKTQNYISRFEGDEFKNPTKETIELFAKTLNVEPSSLFASPASSERPANAMDAPTYIPNDIPEVGLVQAGRGGYFDSNGYPRGDWPRKYHRPADVTDPHAYVVRVEGDSMEPALKKGHRVLCVTNEPVKPGDWVVVQLKNDEMMLKELSYKEGLVVLKSVNPLHRPIVLHKKDIRAIHPVVWIKRR